MHHKLITLKNFGSRVLSHVFMSILPYLKRRCGDVVLPDPGGELSRRIPSNAISSANHHVAEILKYTKQVPLVTGHYP